MALSCMMAALGQTDVVTATLQHGNELTVFKMANALNEAINAAVDGDVITLSEGMFNAFTIDGKSLTIYGAGFEDDELFMSESPVYMTLAARGFVSPDFSL